MWTTPSRRNRITTDGELPLLPTHSGIGMSLIRPGASQLSACHLSAAGDTIPPAGLDRACAGPSLARNERQRSMESTTLASQVQGRRRLRLRMICPAFPAANIYSHIAKLMTSMGAICVATAVNEIAGWDAEVIDENNYRRGPKDAGGKPNYWAIQQERPADVVGLYGGLTSTIPRLFEIAGLYKKLGVRTVAGGQHFVEENIERALRSGVDFVVIGEGEKTIAELLSRFEKGGDLAEVRGIAFLRDGKVVRTAEREPLADFDLLPIPDYSLLRYGRMKVYPVSGIRGCGMDCEFCTVKGKPRFASPERMLERAPGLKWIQTISTGVERVLSEGLVRSDIVVTNMSGIHEVTMSEFVLMLMLMFAKSAPTSFYQQIEGRFKWFPMKVLPGSTVGIIGLGRIGKAVARVSRLHGMRVVGTSRTAAETDSFDNVDVVLPMSRLNELLGESDFVVLALPLTADSANLIGEAELKAMKSEGYLINVSRGGIVDEPILAKALEEGWIAGAGLDVFQTEPLSPDSPLRHLRNVIFSPHVSGDIAEYDVGAAGLFAENLRRYLANEPLLNVVDKVRGY